MITPSILGRGAVVTCISHTKAMKKTEISENRVLTKIFRFKIEGKKESLRKLHNTEFHNLQSSIDVVRPAK